MASPLRLQRVAALLQEEVGLIIARSGVFSPDTLVTLVGVTLSPDLLYATVRVSVYPANSASAALKALEGNVWNLQQALNKRLRMRPVPKIRFMVDQSEAEAAKIEKILKEVEK